MEWQKVLEILAVFHSPVPHTPPHESRIVSNKLCEAFLKTKSEFEVRLAYVDDFIFVDGVGLPDHIDYWVVFLVQLECFVRAVSKDGQDQEDSQDAPRECFNLIFAFQVEGRNRSAKHVLVRQHVP